MGESDIGRASYKPRHKPGDKHLCDHTGAGFDPRLTGGAIGFDGHVC